MTFTYVGTLTTDLDKIRFKIQDTVSGSGVKPNNGNFTDEEIAGLLAIEGNNINRTVAALYEALAVAWAKFIDTKMGSRDEKLSQVAANYLKLATKWRDDYGYGSSILVTGFATRVDGYSDDIDSGEI
jgi:transcription initiation factor IIE alpha subunit